MSMRIFSLGVALLLAACNGSPEGDESQQVQRVVIDCALAGAADFINQCWIEGDHEHEGPPYTIHHPDGSFRRFVWERENGVMVLQTADGADPAEVTHRNAWQEIRREAEAGEYPNYGQDSGLVIRVGDDRYFIAVTSLEE